MSYLKNRTQNAFASFLRTGFPGKVALVLSSALGVGLLPGLPGTFGTVAGMPLVIGAACLTPLQSGILIVLFTALAVWASEVSAGLLAKKDPREVVIDEVAGILITFFLLPFSWLNLCLGFLLFRVFDILKPYPAGRLEKLKGGFGIVADDVMAGVYANLSLRLVVFIFQTGSTGFSG